MSTSIQSSSIQLSPIQSSPTQSLPIPQHDANHDNNTDNHIDNIAHNEADTTTGMSIGIKTTDSVDTPHSALLSDWSIYNQTLLFGLNYRHTLAPKSGFINRMRGQEQAMDIDISCILYDKHCEVVELVWFKKLRSKDGAIRHNGDSIDGTDRGDAATIDKSIDMEQIVLKLSKVAADIEHIALVLSSYHGQALAMVERGNAYIGDDEGNSVLSFNLKNINEECTAMWVAGLSRELKEWRLTTIQQQLDSPDMKKMTVQISNELARGHIGHNIDTVSV